jgi:carbohydrate diacid regulator
LALAIGQIGNRLTTIVEHTAQLLRARVWATDARHMVIASSEPEAIGHPLASDPEDLPANMLRVPVWIAPAGEVILAVEMLSGEQISPYLAQVMVELIANQAALLAGIPDRHQLKNQFVYNLLFDNVTDEARLIRQGQILGIDLTIPRAAILIDATGYIFAPGDSVPSELDEAQMQRRAQRVIGSVVQFFHLPSDTICAYVGGGEVVVLKASSTRDLIAWTDEDGAKEPRPSWADLSALKRAGTALLGRIRRDTGANINIGIGRYHPGILGLGRSYQDARAALLLGRHFHGSNQVHCLDGLGIAAFIGVADERTKVDLARHLLSPLDHEPELIETLDTFFAADCGPSTTACQLSIHRNTLNYRLDKITSLTGLDPRCFDAAVQIRLALLLRSLQQ